MKKPRILAIDDENSFTDLLAQYFEPRGYSIDVASNGADGLELLDRNMHDVVLLALKMAGLSGDEVLKEIRQRNVNTKVIFISAFSDSGKTKERLLGEGVFAFVEKPVTSLKLLEDIVNMAVSTNDRDG